MPRTVPHDPLTGRPLPAGHPSHAFAPDALRLRDLAARLAQGGEPALAALVRRAADDLDRETDAPPRDGPLGAGVPGSDVPGDGQ